MTSEIMVGCNLKICVGAFLRLCHLSYIELRCHKSDWKTELILVFFLKNCLTVIINVDSEQRELSLWVVYVWCFQSRTKLLLNLLGKRAPSLISSAYFILWKLFKAIKYIIINFIYSKDASITVTCLVYIIGVL